MNEEINKIIQSISDFYKLDNALKYYLDRYKAQILLNYITNLQEENEHKDKLIDIANASISNLQKENQKLNKIIDELERWLDDYYKSNRKWYNFDLSNHDRQYFEREYRNTEFMIVKFLNKLTELKNEVE